MIFGLAGWPVLSHNCIQQMQIGTLQFRDSDIADAFTKRASISNFWISDLEWPSLLRWEGRDGSQQTRADQSWIICISGHWQDWQRVPWPREPGPLSCPSTAGSENLTAVPGKSSQEGGREGGRDYGFPWPCQQIWALKDHQKIKAMYLQLLWDTH